MEEIKIQIITVVKEKFDLKQAIIDLVKAHKPKSFIGRLITIKDNSYIRCITDGDVRGSGKWFHHDLYGKELVVLSEQPYSVQVHYGLDIRTFGNCYVDMVRAISLETGKEYEVMFKEGWLRD